MGAAGEGGVAPVEGKLRRWSAQIDPREASVLLLLWARARVATLSRGLWHGDDAGVVEQIVDLGLSIGW